MEGCCGEWTGVGWWDVGILGSCFELVNGLGEELFLEIIGFVFSFAFVGVG
jgi:hypothetical protein